MRSFIKSHRRGSSVGLNDQSPTSTLELSATNDTRTSLDIPSIIQDHDPLKKLSLSPSKQSKIGRFFQRGKNSNSGTNMFELGQTSPTRSPRPSIIGTVKHEWGTPSNEIVGQRVLPNPSPSPISLNFNNTESENDSSPVQRVTIMEDDFLKLPLNTVLEIPDKVNGNKKSAHRRAQIITTDFFLGDPVNITSSGANDKDEYKDDNVKLPKASPSLLPPIDLTENSSTFSFFDEPSFENDASFSLTNDKETELEKTVEFEEEDLPEVDDLSAALHQKLNFKAPEIEIFKSNNEDDGSDDADNSSEFSFEPDNQIGRNSSRRYYKSPVNESQDDEPGQTDREQGFYINDHFVDEDFDDDLNYFDDEDDFNDDEEIFNKKYFSDDEDEQPSFNKPYNSQTKQKNNEDEQPNVDKSEDPFYNNNLTKSNAGSITSNIHTNNVSQPLSEKSQTQNQNQENYASFSGLLHKGSLKYHQIPQELDQDVNFDRYSWISDDYDNNRGKITMNSNQDFLLHKKSNSYDSYDDSLLDEINGIPEDYDYDFDTTPQHNKYSNANTSIRHHNSPFNHHQQRSKSFNNKKSKHFITHYSASSSNNKFEVNGKTVTLFHSKSASARLPTLPDVNNANNSLESTLNSNSQSINIDNCGSFGAQQFIYSTPNSSFVSPNPAFMNSNLDLSPISERSYDDSVNYE